MKENYDKKHKDKMPNVGDLVMLESPITMKGHSPKLTRPLKGQYKIDKIMDTTVVLETFENPKKCDNGSYQPMQNGRE